MTGAGLGRMRDGVFRVVGQPEGLSADIALALAEDRGGDLWIGTAGGGVNRVTGDGVVSYTTEDGLGNNIVLALEPGLSANEVWVGMAAGGLSRIRDGLVTTFGPDEGLLSTQIMDIAAEPDGSLWLATPGSGLQRWSVGSSATVTTADGLPSDFITTLLREPDGAVWVGTRAGLAQDVRRRRDLHEPLPGGRAVEQRDRARGGARWNALGDDPGGPRPGPQ
jgi:ligand-binding sensor domain-containing protein